jgi:hypothetical protein
MSDTSISTESKPRDPRILNAYRHGLTGQIHIFTPEDRVAYEKHCLGIRESLAPTGALEADLAQSIAEDRWRLKRAAVLKSSIFARGIAEPDDVTTGNSEVDTAFAQARVWLVKSKDLQLLSLYENRIQRRVEKNIQLLRQSQQDRQAALKQAAEEAELLAQLAASKGESFDIERDFPREALPPGLDISLPQIARLAAHNRRLAEAKKLPAHQKPLRMAA